MLTTHINMLRQLKILSVVLLNHGLEDKGTDRTVTLQRHGALTFCFPNCTPKPSFTPHRTVW